MVKVLYDVLTFQKSRVFLPSLFGYALSVNLNGRDHTFLSNHPTP